MQKPLPRTGYDYLQSSTRSCRQSQANLHYANQWETTRNNQSASSIRKSKLFAKYAARFWKSNVWAHQSAAEVGKQTVWDESEIRADQPEKWIEQSQAERTGSTIHCTIRVSTRVHTRRGKFTLDIELKYLSLVHISLLNTGFLQKDRKSWPFYKANVVSYDW